ncbi:hypothetical protein LMG28614_05634 [Paraburkholderia ultramafica]|uniref:Uncharacterized protein n=1 Tax=Paraburkholderia ultramafica TaxID=1544867 RepID=A0A6S7BKX4_9BURK|nr:DUF6516 family protein [Paraburkholderia ultramafica]CAB3802534.1 hypothetical protein LMG28614_05634 [Paraburkholderia ultramafica]
MKNRDASLDALLLLDGETFFADEKGKHWVKFAVRHVAVTPERPHGLSYSLTLHGEDGRRLLGFDNAHAIREGTGPGARTRIEYDHRHSGETVRFYLYRDAATLLADFWTEVEAILQERSSEP